MSYNGIPLSALCGIPAAPPPEGQVSNFIDPPTLASLIWGLTMFMTIWALSFTVARIYMNFRKLKASDCMSISAEVGAGAPSVLSNPYMGTMELQYLTYTVC